MIIHQQTTTTSRSKKKITVLATVSQKQQFLHRYVFLMNQEVNL